MDFLHSSPQEVIQEGLKSRLVCLECTFVNDDVSPADAKRFGHTHVRDIAENADRFPRMRKYFVDSLFGKVYP